MAASKWREYAALLSHMCSGWNGYPRGKWYARAEVDMISIDLGIERQRCKSNSRLFSGMRDYAPLRDVSEHLKFPPFLRRVENLMAKMQTSSCEKF